MAALLALPLLAVVVILVAAPRSDRPDAPPRDGAGADTETPPRPAPRHNRFPSPETTGVPAGWVPRETRDSELTVTQPGTVVQDIRFTNGAGIVVKADDVTIRRVELQGGAITNQYGDAPTGCGHNMLVEDATFAPAPRFQPSDFPVIGEGGYTARRIEVDGRGEGPRLSDCGAVVLEDSFIRIHGADPGTAACDQVHSDGVQAVAGVGATARNNTIVMETSCGTSPWYVGNPGLNTGRYTIDRLLVAGGGYVFRQGAAAAITGLRIVDGSWVYGPIDVACGRISPWEAKIVRIDRRYRVTRVVRSQRCDTDGGD
jgi:hypothetical protein